MLISQIPRAVKVEVCSRLFLYMLEKKNRTKADNLKTALNVYRGAELLNTSLANMSLLLKFAAMATKFSIPLTLVYVLSVALVKNNMLGILNPTLVTSFFYRICYKTATKGTSFLINDMLLSEWKNYQRMSTSSALKMIREPSIDFHPDEIDQIFNEMAAKSKKTSVTNMSIVKYIPSTKQSIPLTQVSSAQIQPHQIKQSNKQSVQSLEPIDYQVPALNSNTLFVDSLDDLDKFEKKEIDIKASIKKQFDEQIKYKTSKIDLYKSLPVISAKDLYEI